MVKKGNENDEIEVEYHVESERNTEMEGVVRGGGSGVDKKRKGRGFNQARGTERNSWTTGLDLRDCIFSQIAPICCFRCFFLKLLLGTFTRLLSVDNWKP